MTTEADYWKDVKDYRFEQKKLLGMNCPDCTIKLPKAHPKILMPNQKCWCGYIDKRKRIINE